MGPDVAHGALALAANRMTVLKFLVAGLRNSPRPESFSQIPENRRSAIGAAAAGPSRGVLAVEAASRAGECGRALIEVVWRAGYRRQYFRERCSLGAPGCMSH